MNTMPRQLLTSGTAMAAVVGALLLSAEDSGRTPPTGTPSVGAGAPASLWKAVPRTPASAGESRHPREHTRDLERR